MSEFLKGKLDSQEIKQKINECIYPSGYKPADDLVDDILNQFWFQDYFNSFISDPVFLDHLLNFLEDKKPKAFNRYDFYKYFYDAILPKIPTFQALALAFEINQTDNLPLQEFKKLIKKYEKDLSFKILEEKHLAKIDKRDDGEYFVWVHHSITEFPAAEHILNSNDPLIRFQELAVINQEGVVAIKPSWYGVLRFLLESPKKTIFSEWLLSFLEKHPENIDKDITELIVQENQKASAILQKRTFNLVYGSYFNRLNWIPAWARKRLATFVDKDIYSRLKKDIEEQENKTATFVRRGNAISIVGGMLEYKSPLLTQKEKEFWKKTMIDFANDENENGVLQRHSLDALAYYHDPAIIPLVTKNHYNRDKLVRDAFFEFCYESAPNSQEAINFMIVGIKNGETIYARQGLYEITTKGAIIYFLKQVAKDEEFWKSFLKHESIFDKESGDKKLIITIQKFLDDEIVGLLKQIIYTVFNIKDIYREERSNFLKTIFLSINSNDPNYLFELVENIKGEENIDRLFYDYRYFIALLVTKDNVAKFFEAISPTSERRKRDAEKIVYTAKGRNGEIGNEAYEKAVAVGLVEEVRGDTPQQEWEKEQQKRKKKLYADFLQRLEPSEGKFMTDVFRFFLNNRKELEPLGTKDKMRLVKLAIDEGIKKIEPKKFIVTIPKKEQGGNSFTWSNPASYYGDILDFIREFAPQELEKNRQKIIDFIPYTFAPSQILSALPEIKDKELEFITKVMMGEVEKNDSRYLVPNSYIYMMEEYAKKGCKLPSVKAILQSFVEDDVMKDYEKKSALRALRYFIDVDDLETKKWLEDIFAKREKDEPHKNLATVANELLIRVYHDESAINWRFEQIKIPKEFDSRALDGIVHSVGPVEEEFMSFKFARPLMELQDASYLPKFLDLITYSSKVIEEKRNEKYWDYVNYLWKIAIYFVENLKFNKSFWPLTTLESYVEAIKYKELNWLRNGVSNLRSNYIAYIGKNKIIESNKKKKNIYESSIKIQDNTSVSVKGESKINVENIKNTYNVLETRKIEKIHIEKDIDIFISHASKENSIQRQFIYTLYKLLKSKKFKYKPFVDFIDCSKGDTYFIDKILPRTKKAIFLCDNNFINNYHGTDNNRSSDSMVIQEVTWYKEQRIEKDISSAIVLAFNILKEDVKEFIPPFIRLQIEEISLGSEAGSNNLKSELINLVESVASLIDEKFYKIK